MTQNHTAHRTRRGGNCLWLQLLEQRNHNPCGKWQLNRSSCGKSEWLQRVGGTTWPTLPSCWARHLPDLRHFVAEAAEQQWAEFVEEGVAVAKIQQPAPHHRGHGLPDLPQDNRAAASLESFWEGWFRGLL